MAKFKNEETPTQTTTPPNNMCPNCKKLSLVSFPVHIYYGGGKPSDLICHVNKCVECNEIVSFYTVNEDGKAIFDESKFNLPDGVSMFRVKMLLKDQRSTMIDSRALGLMGI